MIPESVIDVAETAFHAAYRSKHRGDYKPALSAALTAALAEWERLGMVMVPAEPSEEMLAAAIPFPEELVAEREKEPGCLHYRSQMNVAVDVERLALLTKWRAMLAARPKAAPEKE